MLAPFGSAAMTNHLLASLPSAELDQLRPYWTRVRLVQGQRLIERGQLTPHVFFIEDGVASLVAELDDNLPGVQVAMIGREGMVGGLAMLDADSASFACAIMQIPGPALRILTTDLRQILDRSPILNKACMRSVQSLTRQVMSNAACNARDTLAQRCIRWLLMAHERMDGNELPVTQEALSAMLGVSRSGVTVATAALQKAGLIDTRRGRIRVLDRPALESLARGSEQSLASLGARPGHPRLPGSHSGLAEQRDPSPAAIDNAA